MTHDKKIKSWDIFEEGFAIFKKNWTLILKIFLLNVLISGAVELLIFGLEYPYQYFDNYGMQTIDYMGMSIILMLLVGALYILSTAISLWFNFNSTKINFRFVDGHKVHVKDLLEKVDITMILRWLAVSFLLGFGTFVGLILFIFPGLYIMTRFYFAPYLVISDGMTISKALEKSTEITYGHKVDILLFVLNAILLAILAAVAGLILLLIGVIPAIFIAVNVLYLSNVILFKKLHS